MGMFDYVDVQYPVPMPKDPKGYNGSGAVGYQTKDLENCLSTYQIREDGTLWLKKVKSTYVPGNEYGDSVFARIGHMKPISSKWVRVEHMPKTVVAYDYLESSQGSFDYFIEYEFTFAKGKVKKVKLTKFEATDNHDRKARTAEWTKNAEKRNKFCNTWYFKYLFSPWNSFVCSSEKKIYRLLTFISSNLFKFSRLFKF